MNKTGRLFFLLILLISCKEDIQYTGDLIVSAGQETMYDGAPIGQFSVGLFDISELQEPYAYPEHALETKSFIQGKIEFKGINPGNYVVAIIYTDDYRPVQVKIGQTTTLDYFD